MSPSDGFYLIPFCLLCSFLVTLCTKCRRKAIDMTSGRASLAQDVATELQPISYQSASEPRSAILPEASAIEEAPPVEAVGRASDAFDLPQDRASVSHSSSVTDISYNKISVREPLARVLAIDHTYTEVDEERVSSFYEEIAGPALYAKVQRGYEEIGAAADPRHVYAQPEPVYSTASIADPGYEAVGGGYPDSEAEPGYEAISNRKRDMEPESEPGYEVIASRSGEGKLAVVQDVDSEPGYEAIPARNSLRRVADQATGYATTATLSHASMAADPAYEVIKRSPEPLPPTPHLSRQESDLSTDPGYERVRFVPRLPSDEEPEDPVYAKIEKSGGKVRSLEERFCERL